MTKKVFTLGSLFSGSGGFELAGSFVGLNPIWNAEVEPYCIKITDVRFPNVKQLGDVCNINGSEIEPVDVITFGSPCQDLSQAGRQAGIHNGSRSSLFFEAIRIIKEMRLATSNEYPKYAVWENVKGALGSNKGDDFHAVMQAFANICEPNNTIPRPKKWQNAGAMAGNGWSVAWRVLDAQYWGVPQRRQRIFCIADFTGERAGEILFKPESMCRNSTKGFKSWQASTFNSERSIRADSLLTIGGGQLMFENHSQDTRYKGPIDIAQSVVAQFGTGGNNTPFVVEVKNE